MATLQTKYLGLPLKNPFVASSCGLTGTMSGISKCVEGGASAVVLKSLFEEQIDAEIGALVDDQMAVHPEAQDYLSGLGKVHGPDTYLKLIADAKAETGVPVIASVNCVSGKWWVDFSKQIEQAGAAALELNIGVIPQVPAEDSNQLESRIVETVRDVKARIKIPVAVKIGPYFTSLPTLLDNLVQAGADGLVLFNRFYRLDIDTEKLAFITGKMTSQPEELHLALRWVALLSPKMRVPISVSTGVHSAEDAIKAILVGAQVVQIASVLYSKKTTYLQTMIDETANWLDKRGFASLDDIRGRLSAKDDQAREVLGRIQYIKALTGVS
jgi:dihydroorotate dehydrogenase (fumarate)